MKDKRICSKTSYIFMVLFLAILLSPFGSVVCRAESDAPLNQEVEANYYLNETGKSSEYISKEECTFIGSGAISFDQSIDTYVVRNDPDAILDHLTIVPDYSDFLEDGDEIRWMTVYRSHLSYCVIGEKITKEDEQENLDENSEEVSETELTEEEVPEEDLKGNKDKLPEDESLDLEQVDLELLGLEDHELDGLGEDELSDEVSESLLATSKTKTYSSYMKMIESNPSEGTNVTTKGYYKSGDGGGASYIISKTKEGVYIRLSNGLYANLMAEDSMDPRQFGAVGDGTTDDSEAFKQMIKAGVSTIRIPIGAFNLNSVVLKFGNHINIEGSSKTDSILKNVSITAPYGISVSNLTCDTGGLRDVWTPGVKHNTKCMFLVTPTGKQTVEYNNCIFKNAGFVSLACSDSAKFESDSAIGCEFRKISIAAICHSCNSSKSTYYNNKFVGIGDKSTTIGLISAIWIGDVSNVYYTSSDYCVIDKNKFYNLYTGDDFDPNSIHAINGNVIAVRATKADITNNTIKNLVGYGRDREAIYTKVTELLVDSNTIVDGGTGEGYICNKGTDGDSKCTVTNNTIEGEYGCGICQYGTAIIQGNTININHCIAAISTGNRKNQTGSWPMEIVDNKINCGSGSAYTYKGHTYSDYSSGYVIKLVNPINKLTISGNEINPTSDYSSYISVGNAEKDVTVEKNIINASGRTGHGILIYTNSTSAANLSQIVAVKGNNISLGAGQKAVNINFPEKYSKRKIQFKRNKTNFTSGSDQNYALTMYSGSNNNDTLEISGNTSNLDKSVLFISTPSKNVNNKDEGYATLKKKSN